MTGRGKTVAQARQFSGFLLLGLVPYLLGMADAPFRYARSLEAAPGFARLELPDEVIARAAPGLRDLRIVGERGEIGYELEERLATPPSRFPLINVESIPDRSTSALVNRGEHAPLVDSLTLEVAGSEAFLKDVVVLASDDRKSFAEIARSSIFRVDQVASLRVHFAPNDRRYFRVWLDNHATEAVVPVAAVLTPPVATPGALRELPLILVAKADASEAFEVFEAELPSRNLPAQQLRFEVGAKLFSRQVRVYERLQFRDTLSRRLVGSGRIERATTGAEQLEVPLGELTTNRLEVEIDRAGQPLTPSKAALFVRPQRLIFVAPDHGALRLLYGSPTAKEPNYDLLRTLQGGLSVTPSEAKLGPVQDRGEKSTLPVPERGAALSRDAFRVRRRIQLPEEGRVAYLDLVGIPAGSAANVRILDAANRQVPFIIESKSRLVRVPLKLSAEPAGKKTMARVSGFDPKDSPGTLVLDASAPALFQRLVEVYETTRDRRGPTGKRLLASAAWTRRPEDSATTLELSLSPPAETELSIEIDNGDNPPLVLSAAEVVVDRARIDFVILPGDELTLCYDDPKLGPARYDLALVSETVLGAPALPATLGASQAVAVAPKAGRSPWFWAAFVIAGGLIVMALVRALRTPSA